MHYNTLFLSISSFFGKKCAKFLIEIHKLMKLSKLIDLERRNWVDFSYRDWSKHLPDYFNERTLYRIIKILKDNKLIIVKKNPGKRNWYSIDYVALQDYLKETSPELIKTRMAQFNDPKTEYLKREVIHRSCQLRYHKWIRNEDKKVVNCSVTLPHILSTNINIINSLPSINYISINKENKECVFSEEIRDEDKNDHSWIEYKSDFPSSEQRFNSRLGKFNAFKFDEFWKLWKSITKHCDKPDRAEKEWKLIQMDQKLYDKVFTNLKLCKKRRDKLFKKDKFIPHWPLCANWLYEKRWKDEDEYLSLEALEKEERLENERKNMPSKQRSREGRTKTISKKGTMPAEVREFLSRFRGVK